MNLAKIERSIKRALSAGEVEAIERVQEHLPTDRRAAKRMLRQARERTRKKEIEAIKRAGKVRELTKEELRAELASLSEWQAPRQFIDKVGKINRSVQTANLWGNPYKQLREAIPLASLCQHRNFKAVRIEENDPPDAWVRLDNGQEEQVEITEVMEPGRKRGDEYKRGVAYAPRYVPSAQAHEHAKSVISELVKVITAKAGKYNFKPRLLVYLNFGYGPAEAIIKKAIAEIRSTYANDFSEIHILTDTKTL
jgi:hypothetical protein